MTNRGFHTGIGCAQLASEIADAQRSSRGVLDDVLARRLEVRIGAAMRRCAYVDDVLAQRLEVRVGSHAAMLCIRQVYVESSLSLCSDRQCTIVRECVYLLGCAWNCVQLRVNRFTPLCGPISARCCLEINVLSGPNLVQIII